MFFNENTVLLINRREILVTIRRHIKGSYTNIKHVNIYTIYLLSQKEKVKVHFVNTIIDINAHRDIERNVEVDR